MHRGGFDHVPNRIIPPHVSVLDEPSFRRSEYDRGMSRQMPPAPQAALRAPLLGESPMDPYRGYHPPTYNGPVQMGDQLRRRGGFDKGPYGEDLIDPRNEGRQPLLRNLQPRLAVEHVGGEMDISRSRSPSPGHRPVNARSVRDDRKKDRARVKRSRSRSRSRDRDRTRATKPRDTREKEGKYVASSARDQVRDGIVWTNDNYYEFLTYYVDLLNEEVQRLTDRDVQGQRKLREEITQASDSEKDRIVLPPDFNRSDRERMLHCDTTISGLPASIFFGSGYGPRGHYAKYSAAKDLIDKCHRIGVINSELHAAIGDWTRLDRTFKTQFSVQISKAVHAVILLIKKMAKEKLPNGFMTLRQLEPETIDRFKTMLRMVMMDVYYQGTESSPTVVPKALESDYSSRPRDSDLRGYQEAKPISKKEPVRQDTEEMLRLKEKEMKAQMELELEKKRHEMEQEIRQKVLEEERAKIRAELEMEKKLEMMKMQQQQYQIEKEKKELEEQNRKSMMLKKVEDDFNAMVGKLEERFVDIRSKGMNHILDMIYSSATFKTIQLYSATLTSMSFEQKQQLVVDLRSLLDSVTMMMSSVPPPQQQPPTINHMVPMMVYPPASAAPSTSMPLVKIPQATALRSEEVRRVTFGHMRLRSLTLAEQHRLTKGSKVIAQDAKTGNWNLATVVKIREDRATLSVGSTTWKKNLDELYKEDDNVPVY